VHENTRKRGFKRLFKGSMIFKIMEEQNEQEETDLDNVLNEFGEEITNKRLIEIVDEVKKLDSKRIDELFFECGWIDDSHGKNKALPDEKIEEIKSDDRTSFEMIKALFQEMRKEDFLYIIKEQTNALAEPTIEEETED